MKKIGFALLALIVLIAIALVVAPAFIPTDEIKQQFISRVEQKTGRSLSIDGNVSVSVLPSLAVSLEKVSFANARWSSDPTMLNADVLELKLSWLPLLSGTIAIDSFVLDKPSILLEVHKDGTPNWTFTTQQASSGTIMQDGTPDAGTASAISALQLDTLTIQDGTVRFADHQNGRQETISTITMDIRLPDFNDSFSADGVLTWHAQQVEIDATTGSPRKLLAGTAVPVALRVTAPSYHASFEGNAAMRSGQLPFAQGDVTLESDELRTLLLQLNPGMELPDQGLGNALIKGALTTQDATYTLSDATLRLDDITGTGSIAIALNAAKPHINTTLIFSAMDLTPYMDKGDTEIGRWLPISNAHAAAEDGWDENPIDFAWMNSITGMVDVKAESVTLPTVTLPAPHLTATLKNALLTATLQEMEWYGGTMAGTLKVDASQPSTRISKAVTMKNVDMRPMLSSLAEFEKLSGKGAVELLVNAQGNSQKDWVESLSGSGSLRMTEGRIVGVNLLDMARNVKTSFAPMLAEDGAESSTPFSTLNSTFTIDRGIARTQDLVLTAPIMKITGKGSVTLPTKELSFYLVPERVKSAKVVDKDSETPGDTAELAEEKRGLTVPIIVDGPFHSIRFRPDLKATLSQALKNKEAPEQTIEDIKSDFQDFRKDVGSQIKDIFKPFDKKQPAEPAPATE